MQQHPTKDKNMKSDIHTTASIGTCMICVAKPETSGMKIANMSRTVTKHLSPTDQPAMRLIPAFFFDQGYLESLKHRVVL